MLKKKNYTTLKMLTVAFLSSVIVGVAGSAGASDGYNLNNGQTINLTADTSISNTIFTEATGRQTAILAAGETAINTGGYILTANSNGSTQRNYIFNTTTSGTNFKFTGNLAAYATGVGTQEARGLRQNATSSAIWDGNIRVSVTTENANAIGVDIWEGSTATFQGDLTDISTDITGSGRYSYAIQNHTSNGSKVYLQAKQTNLTATGGVFAEAIAVHQGSVYLDGNANITAKNGSSGARAINVESDAGNPYESLVSLKGELVTITASSNDSESIGLFSSGSLSTISSEVDNLVITSKSTNDYATGILAQYGGKINFAKDKNVSINAEGNIAFGVCSEDSWGYSGKIVSHGNLTTTATGKTNGYGVFVTNGSEFSANQLNARGEATEQDGLGIGVVVIDASNVSIGSTGKTSYLLGTADKGDGYGLYLESTTTTTPTAVSLNGIMTVKGSSAGIVNLGGNLTNNADLTVINGIYNTGVITFNDIVTFSGNYGNENAYDIYNNNTVTFNTGADTIVTISNGIGGDANNIGSNIVNINGAGMIDITGALNNQTVNVNNGILSLSNGTENGSNLSGSTVYVNNSGTISTLDNKINDYTSSIKLNDGAKVWADIQIGETTSLIDKYGSFADNITVNLTGLKNLSDLSQLTSVGEQTIQLVNGNVKVDTTNSQYDFGYFTSAGRLVASNVMDGSEIKADGTFKLSMDSAQGGLNNAVKSTNEISQGGEDLVYVNYEMTRDESVSSLQTIKEAKFILNGNNNTITAQAGATGLKIDELSDVLISNTKFTGFDTSETNGVITNNGKLTIKDAEFQGGNGVALVNHGILYSDPTYYSQKVINASDGQITFDGDIFQNINTSTVDGAALYNEGEAVIKGCTFQDNKGQNGGAIYNTSTMTITNTSFTNNTATGLGGAIYNTGTMTITDTSFTNNTATGLGGAIYNTGTMTITDTSFTNNTSMNNFSTAITNSGKLNIDNVSFNNTKLALQTGSVTTAKNLTITDGVLTITDNASLTATNPINLNNGTLDLVAQNNSTTLSADINGSYDVKVTSSAGNQVIIASAISGATEINVLKGDTVIDLNHGGNINNVIVKVEDEAAVIFQSDNDYALNRNIVGQGKFNIDTEKGSGVGLSGNGTTLFSLNSTITDATLGVEKGELILPNEDNLINSNVAVFEDATLNTVNGTVSTFHDTVFDDGANVKLDADILAGTADNFANANELGDTYLSMLNVSGAEKIVHNSASLNLGSATGLDSLTLASNYLDLGNVMTPIRRLHGFVSTTDEGLMLQYVPTGNSYKDFNPSVMVSPVATQIGGYLTQLNSYDEAFRNMDMYMLMTKSQRRAMKLRNKFAAADGNLIFDPTMTSNEQKNAWFRPYSYFENVHLNRGPRVSNVSYGTFVGGDSELYELKNGWDAMWGSYVGYNGSHQAYSGNSIYQNGGTLGVVGMAYKDNFFTGLTVNVGAGAGEASTMFGTDNFSMLMAGIASKTGYNFELKEGRFIIQPSLMLSYSFVNTFDYTNAAGVRMNSDPLHGISIEPGVKFIGNLPHGWQPYVGVSMVWNVMDRTQFHANDVSLPALSVDPYVKYGVGLRKTCGERFSGFLQAFLTNGGRNGVGLQIGFRWVLGKINTHSRIQSSVPTLKDTQITLENLR